MADCKGFCCQGTVAFRENPALPDAVCHALAAALADERKAWRNYTLILDRFPGARPFVNIVKAEARHIAALLRVYERHGLTPPPDETECDSLASNATLETLCRVAAEAEIENVRLFDEVLLPAVADYPDIAAVFGRLRDASEWRHLPAFQRCAQGAPRRGPECGQAKGGRNGRPDRDPR